MRRLNILVIVAFVVGCAHSMVQDGQIRSQDLRSMLARTAATRGLPLPDRLETVVVPHEDRTALLRALMADDWSEAEMREAQEMLTTVGLWPADLDLIDESIRVQAGEVAGLYSPPRHTLYLIEGVRIPEMVAASAVTGRDLYTEFVLSHEIVHALQHNAFPRLFEVTSERKDQDDAVFALHAAIEGDALRYGLQTIAPENALPSAEDFAKTQSAAVAGNLATAPPLLRESLLFPYISGYPLALAEAKQLLAAPPLSTEQVLHGDKRREPFWSISLEPSPAALPSSCSVVGENSMGEFLISVLLSDIDPSIPSTAWQGWNGDRYLVAHCAGRRQFFWITSWDSEVDAREFEKAYTAVGAVVSQRADLAKPPRTERSGANVIVVTDGLASFATELARRAVRTRISNLADLGVVNPGP